MSQKPDPEAIARAIAVETAEDADLVGDFAGRVELGDNVYDYRFESHLPGYDKWQWAVSLYHDEEVDAWTVNESSLLPTKGALLPPKWIPWSERLKPTDLSVTDTLGTSKDDSRLEDGFRKTGTGDEGSADNDADQASSVNDTQKTNSKDSVEDQEEIVEQYRLSRRRVLSRLGRSQVAQRWYEGPHGPKSLSTKTASGLTCETCGFFVPVQGELNMMFGVCTNKWSPDDGRVVSLDHGCGEHSEIEPPQGEGLWPERKPAYDDTRIEIVKPAPREEVGVVEAIENAQASDEPAQASSEGKTGGTSDTAATASDQSTNDASNSGEGESKGSAKAASPAKKSPRRATKSGTRSRTAAVKKTTGSSKRTSSKAKSTASDRTKK